MKCFYNDKKFHFAELGFEEETDSQAFI